MARRDNLQSAKGTYAGFITIAKWSAVAIAVIVAIVVLIIS
ncbi:aa3-type cytochrome c oxidase subunit IV [Croceicoccus sp. F390]|uniref:Aa3-type cytochrome c oxidase subunit IV n=1 Tax=Croceicoccus esteveae TaxID=3075597 RepID=A0ABU2ZFD5_9SPHN|nr:aa3-type cytochrome c oxidase subunit IV [Croceicoccus sp. F390]MDT0575014.1 aa3-type cytochrome c oxidase subunit IV [Croceicoccus sp. F390]